MAGPVPDVFLSVAVKDQARVIPLATTLEDVGIRVRRFEELVDPPATWQDSFPSLLNEVAAVLVVWTPNGLRSEWMRREADMAASSEKLVQVTLDGFSAVPPEFSQFRTIDLTGWSGSVDHIGFHLLETSLRVLVERASGAPRVPKQMRSPEQGVDPPTLARRRTEPLWELAPSAIAALQYADGLRRAADRAEVHMEHLVEALFREGAARALLARAGIDHDDLLAIITKATGKVLPVDVRVAELKTMPPLSAHASRAVEYVLERARVGAGGVGSDALWRGALEVSECTLIEALRRRGVLPDEYARVDNEQPAVLLESSEEAPVANDAREYVRLVTDDPVGLERDALGRRGVAVALESQLRDLMETFPGRSFLVHVDGSWGSGKSTLLRFLLDLVADPSRSRPVDERWLSVDYDAWRQSRVGPPWLTLLQTIRSAVRAAHHTLWARVWFSLRERARLISNWQWTALSITIFLTVLLATLVLVTADKGISVTEWGDVVKLAGGLVPVFAAVWLVAGLTGRFLSLDSRRSARAFLENRADPMEDLAAHFQWVLQQARRPVLLLVDDLDRCPESFVVEMLDAVQKLMREPHPIRSVVGPAAKGRTVGTRSSDRDRSSLVVVVAADGRWIRQAYDNAFASLDKAVREPGATIGSLFLEKLFQLTLPVPQLPDELKRQFLSGLLSADGHTPLPPSVTDLAERVAEVPRHQVLEVLATASPIDRLQVSDVAIGRLVVEREAQVETAHALEPFGHLLDPTPRAMKRFVMAYSVLRAVRTAEGSVIGVGPLALWTIVLTRWPLLAEYLRGEPAAVRYFSASAERIRSGVPAELSGLFENPPDDLRAVMNHEAGPLDAAMIRECCGQLLRA